MAFGQPPLSVTCVNMALVMGGTTGAFFVESWLRWLCAAIAFVGLLLGFMMGSWSFLIPGCKPVGRREDNPPPRA